MNDLPDFPPIVTIPSVAGGGNVRPNASWLKRYPDRVRTANLYCHRTSRTLVGVVLHNLVATTEEVLEPLGQDFYAGCRCDSHHAIDGAALLGAVNALPGGRRRRGPPPVIWVQDVERLASQS